MVMRSNVWINYPNNYDWPVSIKKIICLGTNGYSVNRSGFDSLLHRKKSNRIGHILKQIFLGQN